MQRKKTTMLIIMGSFLFVSFFLYLLLPDRNQTKVESVKAIASVNQEQTENTGDTAAENAPAEEVGQTDLVEENDKPITEDIKAKVREVVEIALDFFKKDQKIVAIGDSLTEGVGDETENGGYVGILNHTFEHHNLNISVENFGKKGNRSDQLLKRLEKEEIASAIKEADMVLITIGANDIMNVLKSNFMNVTMEPFQEERLKYIERLRAILNKINDLNPDTQIYLIGFYNPFERHFGEIKELGMIIENWNDDGKSLAEEYDNVKYIPTKDLFSNSNVDLLAEDEFHPNSSGYKLMAKRVLEFLKESYEESEIDKVEVTS
ncbi:SGNH/GDSL hydrolase family protein [Neobacillus sp. YX16]|uniref:SGNH/GDSL hydrolase family protein n=1 Tax=Neobacillus sp. YX16 TaxID=3047874 RepID=UPI0024C2B051|nr:SGNH/GDSL hydrolase family protein [Neobacillus sp. YX16]WHZ05639.1 SGNH/GDSL hydrolase family protein [Neobacillus sp. YX16]